MTADAVLRGDDVHAALYAVAEVVRSRALRGQPVASRFVTLRDRLDLAVRCPSPTRPQNDSAPAQSVGTVEAADLLGWTTRQVQRKAADLDGRQISGRWVFPRRAILDYAKELQRAIPAT